MYLIADTHIDHRNKAGDTIISIKGRPFGSLEEMKRHIIRKWNGVVSKRDIVYILGDFCWGNQQNVREMAAALNGRKHLIIGNHDGTHSYKWWMDAGFEFVSKYPILYDGLYILSHEPQSLPVNSGMFNIHGHTHSNILEDLYHYNVSVENIDYTPQQFDIIKDRIRRRFSELS